eukprot:XP_001702246.1 predicted protein [Chlamydomonas reinhardtii]
MPTAYPCCQHAYLPVAAPMMGYALLALQPGSSSRTAHYGCAPVKAAALPVPATAAGTSSATTATPTTNEQRRGLAGSALLCSSPTRAPRLRAAGGWRRRRRHYSSAPAVLRASSPPMMMPGACATGCQPQSGCVHVIPSGCMCVRAAYVSSCSLQIDGLLRHVQPPKHT